MPNGWAPEGITTDGERLYAGSLANGAILTADPAAGTTAVLVEGVEGNVVAGIEWDEAGRLWAAGANSGEVRAYDAETGELLEAYPFEAGFLNDAVATPEAVFISDSFVPQIAVVPLGEDGALPAPEEAFVLPITGDLQYGEGFNANGIAATPAGLILIHSGEGQLYRVDPTTGASTLIDTGEAALTAGDGLELVDQTLYVMRNRVGDSIVGEIAAVELDEDLTTGDVVGTVTSEDWDVSTTVAAIGDDLWSVNARFGTDPTPDTEYWMTRVDAPTASEG
jgi:outer membrane protein assembly factor BamB